MMQHATLELQEEHEYIGVVGKPEDPGFVNPKENEDIGTVEQPVDPKTKTC